MDQQQTCRLCLVKSTNIINILDNKKNGIPFKIPEILTKHFWLEININTCSNFICKSCWKNTEDFHIFYNYIKHIQHNKKLSIPKTVVTPHAPTAPTPSIIVEPHQRLEIPAMPITPFNKTNCVELNIQPLLKRHLINKRKQTFHYVMNIETEDDVKIIGDDIIIDDHLNAQKDLVHQSNMESAGYNNEIGDNVNGKLSMNNKRRKTTMGKLRYLTKNTLIVNNNNNDNIDDDNDAVENIPQKNDNNLQLLISTENSNQINIDQDHSLAKSSTDEIIRNNNNNNNDFRILEHIPKLFKCGHCDKIYNRCALSDHIDSVHTSSLLLSSNRERFNCSICPKRCSTKYQLKKHIRYWHYVKVVLDKQFHCTDCGRSFLTKFFLEQHISIYICDICAKAFNSKSTIELHFKSPFLDDAIGYEISCDICFAWLKDEHLLALHMELHKDAVKVSSDTSDCADDHNKSSNRNNRHKNKLKREHICTVCRKTFLTLIQLKEHMASQTGTFKCEYCKKQYHSNTKMHVHRRNVHASGWLLDPNKERMEPDTGEGLYTCAYCPKEFNTYRNMNVHCKKSHRHEWQLDPNKENVASVADTDENVYYCLYCPRKLKSFTKINEHREGSVHCVELYVERCQRKEHIDPITGERFYMCPYCPEKLNSLENVNVHCKQIHQIDDWLIQPKKEPVIATAKTNTTCYSCRYCSKKFNRYGNMDAHYKKSHRMEAIQLNSNKEDTTDTTKNVYKCPYCPGPFNSLENIEVHWKQIHQIDYDSPPFTIMASDTAYRRYTCKNCPRRFNSYATLRAHRTKIHPIAWHEDLRDLYIQGYY